MTNTVYGFVPVPMQHWFCMCTDMAAVGVGVESATDQDATPPLPHHNHTGEDLEGGVAAGPGPAPPATVAVPAPREASLGTRIKKPR